jgi:cellulose synthase/poly-beta-1,6-N-acetylglucosamine synthase-like glycosyltransferase
MMPDWLALTILILAGGTLAPLVLFALHRVYLFLSACRERPEVDRWILALPRVTVQLPVYNEAAVVIRLIDAAAVLSYPRDLLEIQVLDDSDDGTSARAAEQIRYWRDRGVRIDHLRRSRRDGYKAGALARGLEEATGDFLLVLDADFVAPENLVHDLLGPFMDHRVGMVQARWDHLNEPESQLTRCQARLLDAHFFFEQGGRWASGCFMNFNGTGGMWRREALLDAGGWSSDTLTEDLDISYRAQMAGWRFAFRPMIGVPAELPRTVRDLELQQKRWAEGGIQTARKLLPTLLRGPWPLAIKREASVHLLGHLAHPLTVLLGALIVPSAVARRSLGLEGWLGLDLLVFVSATVLCLTLLSAAGRRRGLRWSDLIPTSVVTLALGVGLSATVSTAVIRGALGGKPKPFHRTPKRGDGSVDYVSPRIPADMLTRLVFASWMAVCGIVAVQEGYWGSLPFVLLLGSGYVWLTLGDLAVPSPIVGATDVELQKSLANS